MTANKLCLLTLCAAVNSTDAMIVPGKAAAADRNVFVSDESHRVQKFACP